MFGSKKTATKKVTKAVNPVKKAAGQAQKQVKKAAKQVPKPPSPQKAKKVVKQAPRPVKKAASQASSAAKSAQKKATKATKGWVGGAGGPKDLDKWYGELPHVHWPRCSVCEDSALVSQRRCSRQPLRNLPDHTARARRTSTDAYARTAQVSILSLPGIRAGARARNGHV